MRLYERDFNIITKEEQQTWSDLLGQEKDSGSTFLVKRNLYRSYPPAVRHHLSLFPNNFLDAVELKTNCKTLGQKLDSFNSILHDTNITERDILNFIRKEKAYFLVGSILKKGYLFGHHQLFIFPEFQLPPNYKVDYLIVGKNSHGHHFVFVEFENPIGQVTIGDGSYGETIRKGIRQIEDWDLWLEQNFASLRIVFEQALNPKQVLPKEFIVLDKTRIHYVVVAGRRTDFNEKTYRLKRSDLESKKLNIIHYDNLIEFATETIGGSSY